MNAAQLVVAVAYGAASLVCGFIVCMIASRRIVNGLKYRLSTCEELRDSACNNWQTVAGQLAAANREIAMMRKSRSEASRKGAVTKRAKRIQLPGVGS